jgi:sigma-B regulation protein RsbU (phosphoserine phosphatase)
MTAALRGGAAASSAVRAAAAAAPAAAASGPSARRRVLLAVVVGVLLVVPVVLALLQWTLFERGEAVGWLAIGPLVASLVLGWRGTAALGGWTLLVALALAVLHPGQSTAADTVRVCVVASLSGFAVLNCVLRERRERRLMQITEVARVAQSAILSPVPERASRWSLASRYRSASASAQVGGDLLEVVETPAGLRLVVGDVRGKGLPAVHLAATVLASFREACLRPGVSLCEVARLVDQSVTLRAGDEDFVTAVFVEFDDRGWLQVVNCGHPPPLRLNEAGSPQALSPAHPTSPLGLAPRLGTDVYAMGTGDRLLLYTDGLLEARDASGEFFPLWEHLPVLAGPDLEAALDELLRRLLRHAGGRLDDDLAVLLARNDAPADPGPPPDAPAG